MSWAHVCDMPDPWRWVSAGVLVMTSGGGLPVDPTEQAAWLDKLAQAGISGLVLAQPPDVPPASREMMRLADELRLPLVRFAFNMQFQVLARTAIERIMSVTLQRALLPHGLPDQSSVDVAVHYHPAQSGVAGDWFDVIPLPGTRVAMVMGDVVGHGLRAAATMGRLRTAVQNFASLDLPPDELLSHLDELVIRIDADEPATGGADGSIAGATCLYAIYDPVSACCSLARAGHPSPALVSPDGTVDFPHVPAGPPLGIGGQPFESTEWELAEGSQLVLYSNGLVNNRDRDYETGLGLLRGALADSDRTPEETCTAVLDVLLPDHPSDDITLLVAHTRALHTDQILDWDMAYDPAEVASARAVVTRKLADWDLDEMAFTTELIISELTTNAIRYGSAPVHLRLLRDRSLICEVSDASSTSPHLRYATGMDEGGRGLFLIAQMAQRWGTRYTDIGKIIWAEQPLPQHAQERIPSGRN